MVTQGRTQPEKLDMLCSGDESPNEQDLARLDLSDNNMFDSSPSYQEGRMCINRVLRNLKALRRLDMSPTFSQEDYRRFSPDSTSPTSMFQIQI